MTTRYTSGPAADLDGIQSVIDIAQQAAEPTTLETGKVYAVRTAGGGTQTLNLTGPEYTGIPARKQGNTTVRDAESFAAYFEKHADTDTEVYADADRLTVTAVLDAHTATAARWSGHRLTLGLRKTESWEQWLQLDNQLMPQEAFAEFLEDHLPELLEPSAAEMLEIAQSIQGAAKVEWQNSTRLSSGQRQFQFVETVQAKAGQKGQLTIPEQFTIGLIPFEGSEGYKLNARFRYRITKDGGLTLGYKLERPGDVIRKAFGDVVTAIGEQIEQPIMNGTPA
ncbi:DUF2303 family protein [Streptomyces sp. NBC_00233]|uniref:DUF2303 family protein n=1 Tax=Streptomyces sp. NBC_00233 TaxID=2975686 RepID=UPI00225B7EE8|nr:DUF2303 family protein [Streptomyces sp. NBC_00233]MCX5229712.1 YfdQ family protein [Streptomyces sp. NBC_00233]